MAVAEKKFVLPNLTSINRLPISKFAASDTVTTAYVASVGQCPSTTGLNKSVEYGSLYQASTLEQRMSERSGVRSVMVDVSSHALKKNPDWANLGDFRQKLPEHPLLFPQSQQDPP